jgi:hypothetical protein
VEGRRLPLPSPTLRGGVPGYAPDPFAKNEKKNKMNNERLRTIPNSNL